MANQKTQQQIRKHNSKLQNTTANYKTLQQIRKHNGKSENTTAKQKTQQQITKHNSKLQNTTANQKTQWQIRKHNGKSQKQQQIRKHYNINRKGRYPRVTCIVADWSGPSFEPEGHGLHFFKIRALPVKTYVLLLKNILMQDMDMT